MDITKINQDIYEEIVTTLNQDFDFMIHEWQEAEQYINNFDDISLSDEKVMDLRRKSIEFKDKLHRRFYKFKSANFSNGLSNYDDCILNIEALISNPPTLSSIHYSTDPIREKFINAIRNSNKKDNDIGFCTHPLMCDIRNTVGKTKLFTILESKEQQNLYNYIDILFYFKNIKLAYEAMEYLYIAFAKNYKDEQKKSKFIDLNCLKLSY